MNYKLVVEYDGTRYNGWQRLGSTSNTIQGKIEEVLGKMTGKPVELIGSGRTDAGVHALGQVANFHTTAISTPGQVLEYLNKYLPEDIVIKSVEAVDDRFHSRYKALSKQYHYRIWNHPVPTALWRKFSYHYPEALNLEQMREGAALLMGTHDFKGFSTGKSNKSTVRTITDISLSVNGEILELSFEGDGFLYNMVRIITGTLLEIGSGHMKPGQINKVFETGDRTLAGPTVPPQGLYLVRVDYK